MACNYQNCILSHLFLLALPTGVHRGARGMEISVIDQKNHHFQFHIFDDGDEKKISYLRWLCMW